MYTYICVSNSWQYVTNGHLSNILVELSRRFNKEHCCVQTAAHLIKQHIRKSSLAFLSINNGLEAPGSAGINCLTQAVHASVWAAAERRHTTG